MISTVRILHKRGVIRATNTGPTMKLTVAIAVLASVGLIVHSGEAIRLPAGDFRNRASLP